MPTSTLPNGSQVTTISELPNGSPVQLTDEIWIKRDGADPCDLRATLNDILTIIKTEAPDTNFAKKDLTFDANRTHDAGSHLFQIDNMSALQLNGIVLSGNRSAACRFSGINTLFGTFDANGDLNGIQTTDSFLKLESDIIYFMNSQVKVGNVVLGSILQGSQGNGGVVQYSPFGLPTVKPSDGVYNLQMTGDQFTFVEDVKVVSFMGAEGNVPQTDDSAWVTFGYNFVVPSDLNGYTLSKVTYKATSNANTTSLLALSINSIDGTYQANVTDADIFKEVSGNTVLSTGDVLRYQFKADVGQLVNPNWVSITLTFKK